MIGGTHSTSPTIAVMCLMVATGWLIGIGIQKISNYFRRN